MCTLEYPVCAVVAVVEPGVHGVARPARVARLAAAAEARSKPRGATSALGFFFGLGANERTYNPMVSDYRRPRTSATPASQVRC